MTNEEMQVVIQWLKTNAYAAIDNQYWVLRDFPTDKVPDRFHIPISCNTKIWCLVKADLIAQNA